MSLPGFHFKFWLAAFMAVLLLNVSCKTMTKSASVTSGCGKEIVATKSDPCDQQEPPRCRESKQRIATTLAATEKLKRLSPESVNPVVKKEAIAIPQPEIIPEVTIAVEKKPIEKMAEVEKPTAIEKKPVETIAVLERTPGEKLAVVEKPVAIGNTLVETVPLGGSMPIETPLVVESVTTIAKPPLEKLAAVKKINGIKASGAKVGNMATPILVEADHANRIIVADEREVEIKGNNCVIVISGGCKILKLSGEKNQVQCDSASYVNISGNQNTLVLGVMGRSVITGNRNIISWGEGMDGTSPIAESTGQENEIGRLE